MDGLVPYSSSDSSSDNEEETEKALGRITSPKLPCALSKLGASSKSNNNEAEYSNTSLHNNRIRSFKHERGNWATYVYVSVDESILNDIPELCREELENVLDLQLCTDLHISLSRTVVLQYHWIDNFVRSLEKVISSEVSFDVFLEQLEIYANEEKTRTFVGFKVHSTKLMNLMQKVDSVMEDFKLQRFYEDPSFHVSFAWCLGDKFDLLMAHHERLTAVIQTSVDKSLINAVSVNDLHCKIGHKIYTFKLNKLS